MSTTYRRFLVFVCTTLVCGIFATGCDDILTDPNFHTWCGDQLCAWKLESGEIRKAPTWHPKDYGVELLDSNDASHVTAISQIVDKQPKCMEFTTVADVAAEAQVSIQVDFDSDGTIDYEQPIAATGFREQKTQITAPASYVNIKFILAKKGTGRAVLAQIDVRSKDGCTAAPVVLKKQAQGTSCSIYGHGQECLSGICCDGLCSECCASGIYKEPVEDAGPDAGDGGAERDPSDTCPDGATCGTLPLVGYGRAPKDTWGVGGKSVPRQCDPGTGKRPARTECLLDMDCTSGVCEGAVWDIENVAVGGGQCPPPPVQGKDCIVSSVRAGTCR